MQRTHRGIPVGAVLFVVAVTLSTQAQEKVFLADQNGTVAMEIESVPMARSGWKEETRFAGYSGRCYYRCTVDNMTGASSSTYLTFKFRLGKAGKYIFRLHGFIDGPGTHEHNDVWVRFSGTGVTMPVDNVQPNGGFCKTTAGLSSSMKWGIGANNICVRNTPWAISLPAGDITLTLAARSAGYCIDKLFVCLSSTYAKASTPESKIAGQTTFALREVMSVPTVSSVNQEQYTLQGALLGEQTRARAGSKPTVMLQRRDNGQVRLVLGRELESGTD